ncbi:MAG: hypothetical protein JXR96_15855, partial [Deltaproteobacteria bacterium]|nr:hypothetical protein [Deltaproteobacteria bacterium]
ELGDELWLGQRHSPFMLQKVETRGLETEVTSVAVGELPRDVLVNPIAVLPDERLAIVSNLGSNDLSVVALDAKEVIGSIAGFDGPMGLGVWQMGNELWVANSQGNSLSIVDLESMEVTAEVDLGARKPANLIVAPKVGKVFVGAWTSDVINRWSVIGVDLYSREMVDEGVVIYYGDRIVDAMALSPDQTRLYVARNFLVPYPDPQHLEQKVAVYDTADLELLEEQYLERSVTGIALTPDGELLVVTSKDEGMVSVFDAETWELAAEIPGVHSATGLDLSWGGGLALVTSSESGAGTAPDSVHLVDLGAQSVLQTWTVDDEPTTVVFGNFGRDAYVVNTGSGSLSIIENMLADGEKPAGRAGAVLLADRRGEHLVLAGGETEAGVKPEKWVLDMETMTWERQQLPDGSVYGLAYPSVAHDAESGRVLLFGGLDADGLSDGLLVYRPGRGLGIAGSGSKSKGASPAARIHASAVYLPELDALYVFGGKDNSGARNDSWVYSLESGTWAETTPDCAQVACPEPRWGAAAIALSSGRVAIFGGETEAGPTSPRVWKQEVETGGWMQEESATEPVDVVDAGLRRIEYRGKRLDWKLGEIFDPQGLSASFPHGGQRSYRWVGQIRIERAGEYSFGFDTQGGFRAFVDGEQLKLERGRCHGHGWGHHGWGWGHAWHAPGLGSCEQQHAATRPVWLDAGWHDIVVDLTVCRRGGHIEMSWAGGPEGGGPIPPERFRYQWGRGLERKGYSMFFGWLLPETEDFDRTPANDDWGKGSPGVLGLSFSDHFAVSWEGMLRIEREGEYRFVSEADDAAFMMMDGELILQGLSEAVSEPIWLEPGLHEIRYVMLDMRGEARAHLRFDESCPELGGLLLPASRCETRFEAEGL